MPTRAQGLPDVVQFVNGNDGAGGGSLLNAHVPGTFKELGLVMEEMGDLAGSWDRGTAHVGSQLADGNHHSAVSSLRLGNNSIRISGGNVVGNRVPYATGQPMGVAQHHVGQPQFAEAGPGVHGNRTGMSGSGPETVFSNQRMIPVGQFRMQVPSTSGMVLPEKGRIVCLSNAGMPTTYVMVRNSGTTAEEWDVVGRVVRSGNTPQVYSGQAQYAVNNTAAGPGSWPNLLPPSVILTGNAAGSYAGNSGAFNPNAHLLGNGSFHIVHHAQGVGYVQDQGNGVHTYRPTPPRLQGLRYPNFLIRNDGSGGIVKVNQHGVHGQGPTTESSNGTAGVSRLQTALLGIPLGVPEDSSLGHKHQGSGNESTEVSTKRRGRKKGTLVDVQQLPVQDGWNPKQGGQTRKDRNSTSARGGKQYSSRKKKDMLLLEGEAEEIVVEVDLPMLMTDSDEEGEGVGGDGGDPLAPNEEDVMAVDCMRKEKKSKGTLIWSPLTNGRRILLQNEWNSLKGRKPMGGWRSNVQGGIRKPTGGWSELREISIRLERCDAPGGIMHQRSKKETELRGQSLTDKNPGRKEGTEPKTVPSELVSPSGSSALPKHTKAQETDYWLQMLDRERREALEALEVVRKRLDEEKSSCQLSLTSVNSTVMEEGEFPLKTNETDDTYDTDLSSSLDERRWTLLEEEFTRREAIRRKSISETNDVAVQANVPMKKTSDSTEVAVVNSVARPLKGPAVALSKMLTQKLEDSRDPASRKSHKPDGAGPLEKTSDGADLALTTCSSATSDAAINDPRISKLQKLRAVGLSRGMPKMRECFVKLERCDHGTVAVANRSKLGTTDLGTERVPDSPAKMVIDSVEMRSVAVTSGPVTQGDRVSQTSLVCLQGRVGLKRGHRRGSTAKECTPSSPRDEKQIASSPSNSGRSYVMVEMKKLVVVMKKVDRVAVEREVEMPRLKSRRLRSLEAPRTDTDSEHRGGRGSSSSADVSRSDSLPKLKDCYVRLERCDQVRMERNKDGGPPRPKRRKHDPV